MLSADYIIDLGPGAGRHGGEVSAAGTPDKILKENTLTSDYLSGKNKIKIPEERRKGNGKEIIIWNLLLFLTALNASSSKVRLPISSAGPEPAPEWEDGCNSRRP